MNRYARIAMLTVLICSLVFLTGCKDNKEDLQKKVISELDYIDEKTIQILNGLNNLSFENYSVISQKVELDSEKAQGESGGKEGEESGQQKSGGSEKSGEGSEGQQGENQNEVNATTMVANTELGKNRNNIDWAQIKKEIETINESWSVVVLDLYALNVQSDIILDFSDKINASMVAIANEDKAQTLSTAANLYSSIPEFLKQINTDENTQKLSQIKSYIVNAYSLTEDMGNAEIENNIKQAVQTYSEIMSNIDFTKDKTQKINRAYVLLNEIVNALPEKNQDVFFVKYKNFMKEIDKI